MRKAQLSVEGLPREPLTVSLYEPRDASFRQPAFRARVAGEGLKIPAGSFLLSLAAPGRAPDMQRLTARPAGRIKVVYHPRSGWSLVVRCRATAGDRPVPRAAVAVAEVAGFGIPDHPQAEAASDADGLALFSGLVAPLVRISLRHPAFVPEETSRSGELIRRGARGHRARVISSAAPSGNCRPSSPTSRWSRRCASSWGSSPAPGGCSP